MQKIRGDLIQSKDAGGPLALGRGMKTYIPLFAALALAGCMPAGQSAFTSVEVGRNVYAANCVACHGASATGTEAGPDLTRITARAGGVWPQRAVLDKIDGYGSGDVTHRGLEMPNMGDMMTGPLERVQTPQGRSRPLPRQVIALEAYLRSLQE